MYENKIEEISNNLKGFLSRESQRLAKISELENTVNKIQTYISRPETMMMEDVEEKKSFNEYIRKGIQNDLITKSFSGSSDEGEVMVTPTLSKKIISMVNHRSIMRQVASIENISTKSLDIIYEDGDFAAGWVSDSEEREDTTTPKIKKKSITVHEIYAQPKATQNLINDSEIDIENWLAERISDSFINLENKAFIDGDGSNKPIGILINKDIQQITVGSAITVDILINLINSLDENYIANASFIMNRKTLSLIQSLKDKNGRFIWSQSMANPLEQTIFGVPVFISSHMPNIGKDKLSVAFGDFKSGYKIVDRSGISIMRDPFTEKPFIKFYATKRVGGDVVNPHAIKLAKFTE
jgi:HK97 family phage major capsid protein